MTRTRGGKGFKVVLLGVVVFILAGGTQWALTRTQQQTPTFEELVSWVELLRARQEVLTADVGDFKAEVAEATAAIRTEMATEMATVRTEMADEDAEVSAIAVPIGGIIAWHGNINSIPDNFEVCDGSVPAPGAVFSATKPDLRSRFIRGARASVGAAGGRDLIADATTLPHILTISEMPSHTHPWYYGFEQDDDGYGSSNVEFTHAAGPYTPPLPFFLPDTPVVAAGGDQPHSHSMPGHDNRPKFYELFYIIRVK